MNMGKLQIRDSLVNSMKPSNTQSMEPKPSRWASPQSEFATAQLFSEGKAMYKPEPVTPDYDQIYEKFKYAETGTISNDEWWKRTIAKDTPGGSTAFGPVQMTGTLLKDVKRRKNQFNITPDEETVLNSLIEQSKLFAKHGNNKGKPEYDPKFDYSGEGNFFNGVSDQSVNFLKNGYKSIAKKVMAKFIADSGGDEQKAIEKWRGKPKHKDPEYWNRYNQGGRYGG